MDVFLISRLPSTSVEDFTVRLEESAQRFLGPQYTIEIRAVVANGEASTVIALARNRHNPMPELFFAEDDTFIVFSGYVVDELRRNTSWRRYFGRMDRTDRPMLRSPGGVYSYATIRRSDGQICAGHSTPTLEPVYYSESNDSLHIGNDPLLVHAARTGFARPQMNEMFFFSAVSSGVAIDDSTPFVGCHRVPPRYILVNHSGIHTAELRRAPTPEFGRYRISTAAEREKSVRKALIAAGSILERLPPGEFRVSGGKDSRLIAAYLKHAGIETTPVNQNFPQEIEGQVADMVARVLGRAVLRVPIEDFVDTDIVRGTTRKIAFAGGLPAVASLQYPVHSEGHHPGEPLIMGHAHLQRGGFVNTRIRNYGDALEAARSRTVSPFLRPSFVDHNLKIVRDFVNGTISGDKERVQSISFSAYLQYAMNYQFQSLYAYVRSWNLMITPLVDERFALLCESIAHSPASWRKGEVRGIVDLRSERIAMNVTGSLAPDLLGIPLAAARYRSDTPDSRGHALRDPSTLSQRSIAADEVRRVFNTRRIGQDIRAKMWNQIEESPVRVFGESACRPDVWRYVSDPTVAAPEGVNVTLLNQFLWSLFGYSIILGSDWWEALSAQD